MILLSVCINYSIIILIFIIVILDAQGEGIQCFNYVLIILSLSKDYLIVLLVWILTLLFYSRWKSYLYFLIVRKLFLLIIWLVALHISKNWVVRKISIQWLIWINRDFFFFNLVIQSETFASYPHNVLLRGTISWQLFLLFMLALNNFLF